MREFPVQAEDCEQIDHPFPPSCYDLRASLSGMRQCPVFLGFEQANPGFAPAVRLKSKPVSSVSPGIQTSGHDGLRPTAAETCWRRRKATLCRCRAVQSTALQRTIHGFIHGLAVGFRRSPDRSKLRPGITASKLMRIERL